ncbi:hypothetical protein [Pedobacter aquatilis]|uniref:hypothetical protein n=1 Tax=Pedobacter aquatilis TaxID=351343 RepID=UPI00292D17D4|nr:hypothetical protein [Pedobacter aquatilis]
MNQLSENRPFIFKTIGKNGELRSRGLDQMADILQIAYDLFQDPFLNESLGDPFLELLEHHPEEHEKFNRTEIERTIMDCQTYEKIKLEGKYITVTSQGIENSLEELEMIWFVANDLRAGENSTKEFEQVPHGVKLISMGKLSAILKYYLATSHKLITDVRAKLLKDKLHATPEQNKKQFLLRTKTDLLIQKHETKVIVAELLRIIELELDLLVQLESLPKKTVLKADYSGKPRTEQPTLPVELDIDFEHEMSFNRSQWKKFFIESEEFLRDLKLEFAGLPAKPKRHWYFNESISDKEWNEDRSKSLPTMTNTSNQVFAAPFVSPSPLEPKAWELINKFNAMVADQTVDSKYFGRFLEDTPIVQNLKKLDSQLKNFKDYVFSEASIDTFAEFSKNAVKSMLRTISQFKNSSFRQILLSEISKVDIAIDMAVLAGFSGKSEQERTSLLKRFNVLNIYAQEIISAAIEELNNAKTEDLNIRPSRQDFHTIFKDPEKGSFYIEVLRKVTPPIIGEQNQYILGERKKGAIVCWFDILSVKGIVHTNIPPVQKARLLNEMFSGLSISDRSTGSINGSAERKYKVDLERLIAKI